MRIETKRLLIRSIENADIAPLINIWTDSEVTRHLGGPRDREFLLEAFAKDVQEGQTEPFDLYPIVEMASGKVVGHCGLLEKDVEGDSEIELIYIFDSSAWGKGYATEAALALRDYAFGVLELSQLIALIDPQNIPSARVAEKVGLSFERETVRAGGKIMHVYSIHVS